MTFDTVGYSTGSVYQGFNNRLDYPLINSRNLSFTSQVAQSMKACSRLSLSACIRSYPCMLRFDLFPQRPIRNASSSHDHVFILCTDFHWIIEYAGRTMISKLWRCKKTKISRKMNGIKFCSPCRLNSYVNTREYILLSDSRITPFDQSVDEWMRVWEYRGGDCTSVNSPGTLNQSTSQSFFFFFFSFWFAIKVGSTYLFIAIARVFHNPWMFDTLCIFCLWKRAPMRLD